MLKITFFLTLILLNSFSALANDTKPFSFNNITLGGYGDSSWRWSESEDWEFVFVDMNGEISMNKEISMVKNKKYQVRLSSALPFEKISIKSTSNNKQIYYLSPELQDNYFTSYEQCKSFMKKIIDKIKLTHKDAKYQEYEYNFEKTIVQDYDLYNSLKQNIKFTCFVKKDESLLNPGNKNMNKKKNIRASITFTDNALKSKIFEGYKKVLSISKPNKKPSTATQEANSIKLFK